MVFESAFQPSLNRSANDKYIKSKAMSLIYTGYQLN